MRLLAPFLALLLTAPAPAQEPPARDPFAGCETRLLGNGLRVWFLRMPGAPTVSISVTVPYGMAEDPPGKDELAHFVEHMLFSDHGGRTEDEIKREIEDLGGARQAFTHLDRTFFNVRIDREHALMAVDWLGRIVEPHAMDPAVVNRQRAPIALEINAEPRDAWEWLEAWYADPPWLRLPEFWKREFGLETRRSRDDDPWHSLATITPDDLRGFYDRYYDPRRMILTVIGDLDRDAVFARAETAFSRLPARAGPPLRRTVRNPGRERRVFRWEFRADSEYQARYKLYAPTRDDHLMLVFVRDLLEHRLNTRLRFGERKAAYAVAVRIGHFLPGLILEIQGGIRREELAFARQVFEEEVAALRDASLPPEVFAQDKAKVVGKLLTENTTPENLEWFVQYLFYEPELHPDFPDLAAFYRGVDQAAVAAFARRHLVPRERVLRLTYAYPLSQGVLVALVSVLVLGAVLAARALLGGEVPRRHIRALAPFRLPPLFFLLTASLTLFVLAWTGRLLVAAFIFLQDAFLARIDSFWFQGGVIGLAVAGGFFLLLLFLARIPVSLWVFEDRVIVRHLAFRAVVLRREQIAEVSLRRFREIWLTHRLKRCRPLTSGLSGAGIYLETVRGRGWFFQVADQDGVYQELKALLG